MGILSFAKKQFIDILQWTEDGDDLLAWRFPTADHEIQQGARLVVRETQKALFVDQGHVADLFGPGTYTIKTANLPVLTDIRHWDKLFESPFKSEVYFFSTRLRLNQTCAPSACTAIASTMPPCSSGTSPARARPTRWPSSKASSAAR